ncbi:MAG: fibrobacter succinogenes major paralogous domain-containing protein [Fibrobacter sp.]|nr:fibrobacter succinogenes major paralogous domain-containing protein [Fibrobacter sp.]
MSLRGNIVTAAISCLLLVLVACGDDDSDFATRPSDDSSLSSSSAKSSGSVSLATPCKTETEDNCEYGELVDDRDGQTYKTVKIGDQVWMAENLNFEMDNSSCYNDSVEYCEKYGLLYTWAVAMDSADTWSTTDKDCGYGEECSPTYPVRGICPDGWHLPTQAEWDTLFTAVGGKSVAGIKLKSTNGWNDDDGESGNGMDAFSFLALPAGYRDYGGYYKNEGNTANFWSSTGNDSSYAYEMRLNYSNDYAGLYNVNKNNGFSIRCLKDDP